MARYPLMHTSHRINPEPWRVKQALRRMKGGTIFGTSTRMRMSHDPMKVLAADQEKAMMERWLKQRMKGGTLFGPGDLRKVLWAIKPRPGSRKGATSSAS